MEEVRAFTGTLGHIKAIQSRQVVQFIIEVPHEQAMQALNKLGGMPNPAQPFAVAVARLMEG